MTIVICECGNEYDDEETGPFDMCEECNQYHRAAEDDDDSIEYPDTEESEESIRRLE